MRQYTPYSLSILISLIFLANPALASEFDLRISDDAIHTNLSNTLEDSQLSYGGGYFYKDSDNSINVVNLDIHSNGQTVIGNLPTTIGLGMQGTYFKESSIKGGAAALGGWVRVNLPETPGLSLESALHYAPDVLAFSDSERYIRTRFQANYRVIRTVDISAGYRYLHTKLTSGDSRTFESGVFVGLKMLF